MILTVFLSDGDQMLTEVPVTPDTLCKDVVEFCKEAGENGCHLAEVWRGNGKQTEPTLTESPRTFQNLGNSREIGQAEIIIE